MTRYSHRFRPACFHGCLFFSFLVVVGGVSAGSIARATTPPAAPLSAPVYLDASAPLERRVDDLLARLSVVEKIGQLSQSVVDGGGPRERDLAAVRTGELGSFILSAGPERTVEWRNELQRVALARTPTPVPLLFGYDAIHGYRTVFPIPLGLAATWDPELVEKVQAISARETRAAGIDWTFAPMCDIARDPRWGRVAESFGEDPHLVAHFAAASVRGFQGDNPGAPDRVAATLKHFVGYGASIGGRDYHETEIPPFIMRNLHLPPFQAGVRAGAFAVMSGFNANDGIPVVANPQLLTRVLRDEWQFRGFVVSDWEAVAESMVWGFSANAAEAARTALTAGNDIEMVSATFRESVPAQLASGAISSETLDRAVRRVLRAKLALGLFEHPLADPDRAAGVFLQPDALALARTAAARSAVLLQNSDDVLPLSAQNLRRVALIGPLADDAAEMLGTWPGHGHAEDVVTLASGLRAKLPPETQLDIVRGCDLQGGAPRTRTLIDGSIVADESASADAAAADDPHGFAAARAAAENADVVILALGEPRGWSGENASRATLGLTGRQQQLLEIVAAAAAEKPLVLVTFGGRPLIVPHVPAARAAWLHAWHPGIQGGHALADVLFGDVAPTGRLAISWPRSIGQLPVFYNRYATGRPHMREYRDEPRAPQFVFGYGLTYTTFSYSNVEITPSAAPGAPSTARAIVTNTGARAGEEVVQLYVRDLACAGGARPAQELRGWQRIALAPGETRTVEFALDDAALGFWSREGAWRVEPGDFHVWIAPHTDAGTPAILHHESSARTPQRDS